MPSPQVLTAFTFMHLCCVYFRQFDNSWFIYCSLWYQYNNRCCLIRLLRTHRAQGRTWIAKSIFRGSEILAAYFKFLTLGACGWLPKIHEKPQEARIKFSTIRTNCFGVHLSRGHRFDGAEISEIIFKYSKKKKNRKLVYCQCHKSLMLAGRDMCVTKKSQKRLSGWNLTLSATYCNYIVTPVKSEIFMKNIWYIIWKPEGFEPWFKLVLIPHRLLRCAKKWAMNLMFINQKIWNPGFGTSLLVYFCKSKISRTKSCTKTDQDTGNVGI